MVSIYDKSGQDIHLQRETTYGAIYDPESTETVWTKISSDYVHWRKLDYIPDTFDAALPIIEKLKVFDVGDSKHASAIQEGNIEPVEFTISMNAQGLEILMFTIGAPAFSTHNRKIVETISCLGSASISDADYFLIDTIEADDSIKYYAIYFDTQGAEQAKPTISGIHADNVIDVDISAGALSATEVADLVEIELELLAGITSADNVAELITIVRANAGSVQPTRDGAAATDFTFNTTTLGSTTYTVTEALTTDLPSFTMHLEQRNATAAENIVWDLFGCVVDSVEVNVAFGDKVVKYSVTIKCPYAIEGDTATNLPGKKLIDGMPAMSSLQEGAAAYIIMDAAVDRTPSTVEKVLLTISNNVKFQPDIAAQYMKKAISTRRDVKLNIVGATHEKELFNWWQEKYKLSGTDYIPNGASGALNSVFKLQRDATYDYVSIAVHSWLLRDHNFSFVNVDDAIKMVDMLFEDGAANASGIMLDATTFVSPIDRILMIV